MHRIVLTMNDRDTPAFLYDRNKRNPAVPSSGLLRGHFPVRVRVMTFDMLIITHHTRLDRFFVKFCLDQI